FIPVGRGRTACGDLGAGRLAEPDEIVMFIEAALARPARMLRVLVTSGPTAEPIDDVRVLTNLSSGLTGAGIASHFARCGHHVVLLRGRGSADAAGPVIDETFGSAAELDAALARRLAAEEFDAIIHAAAVADFAVEAVETNGAAVTAMPRKLASDRAPVLHLRRTPKLVESLRARSRNPAVRIVAFKLTSGADAAAVRAAVGALFDHAAIDWVVHNDLQARKDPGNFPAEIHHADGSVVARCETRTDLAETLERLLSAQPPAEPLLST
ncbi:MAG: coaBC, partial [Verrucomicrobia bacterium]|nr:coaBC [Verrucomicrobiota bacterium]